MTFTLTKSLTFAQISQMTLVKLERMYHAGYRKLMNKVNSVAKKPLIKALFKINISLEKALKKIMQALHLIENTVLFKFSLWMILKVVEIVKKDGLKFTVLLTSLSYGIWCYFI